MTLTQQRIKELLEEIARYEIALRDNENEPTDLIAMAWATLAIAKAKLTALQGD